MQEKIICVRIPNQKLLFTAAIIYYFLLFFLHRNYYESKKQSINFWKSGQASVKMLITLKEEVGKPSILQKRKIPVVNSKIY